MQRLLPIPTINHIPKYDRAENLCNKMDSIFLGVQEEIINLKNILDPFACPAKSLDVFAKYLNTYTKPTDPEHIKRSRIFHAIENNKLFGTWIQVKNLIDDICRGDAKLVFNMPDDAWFLCGDGGVADVQAVPTWSVFGLTEQTAQTNMYGISLDGVPTLWQKGVFNIDVDNNHLTQKEIDLLYETLYPSTPVGMTITVGYAEDTKLIPYFILGVTNDTL